MLAKIDHQRKNWETSYHYYRRARNLFIELSDRRALVRLYANWGKGLYDGGDRDSAVEMWQNALTLCAELGMDQEADQVRRWLGED
jgi:tetratricopeptide (TPR) repeat protein